MTALMTFGAARFDALQVAGFSDDRSWKWVSHETIEGLPVLQGIAREARKPQLRAQVHPFLGGGAVIAVLEAIGDALRVEPLQLGNGFVLGWFVLEKIQRDWVKTLQDGTLIAAGLTLSFIEHRPPEAPDPGPLAGIIGFAVPSTALPAAVDTSGDPSEVPLSEIVRT